MSSKQTIRLVLTIAIVLMTASPGMVYLGQLLGISLPSIHPVFGASVPVYVSCDTFTGGPSLTPQSSCAWAPTALTPPTQALVGEGGGGVLDINAGDTGTTPPQVNGFDITFTFDPTVVSIVAVDQSGTGWTTALVLAKTVDNVGGNFRLAEVLLGGSVSSSGPLFRIDFDVVGVGVSPIHFVSAQLTNPSPVATLVTDGSFDDTGTFTAFPGTISFVLSPTNPNPNSTITFTATANCATCSALSFSWDFDSNGVTDAATNPATISPPYPAPVNVVTLTATDGVNTASIVREVPLSALIDGASTVAVNSPLTLTGAWIGGIPPYLGASLTIATGVTSPAGWRFCPGTGGTTGAISVCNKPQFIIASTALQTNSPGSVTYSWGGVFNESLSIKDSGLVPALSTALVLRPINVTGTPFAYSVIVTPSASTINTGVPLNLAISAAYPGDSVVIYDNNNDTKYDPSLLISDVAPAAGTTLKTDAKIKFLDLNSNGHWDLGEAVVYDSNANGLYDAGEPVIAGQAPVVGSTISSDPLIKFVDANSNNLWDPGETVTYDSGVGTPVVGANNNIYDAGEPVIAIVSIKFVDTSLNGSWNSGEPVVFDTNGNGLYDSGEPVLSGTAPSPGTKLATDPKLKFNDLSGDGHWDAGEAIAYDINSNGLFDNSNGDTSIASTLPATGAILKTDPKLKFVGAVPWVSPDPVVYDNNNNNVYNTGELVIFGTTPANGAALSTDAKIKFFDFNGNGVWDVGEPVVYDNDASGTVTAGDILIGTLLNQELVIGGTAPAYGASLLFDTHIRMIGVAPWIPARVVVFDINNNNIYNCTEPLLSGSGSTTCTGGPVGTQTLTIDNKIKFVDSVADGVFSQPFYSYPYRSLGFSFVINWGDGQTTSVAGGTTNTASHTYSIATGPTTIVVVGKETSLFSSPSGIQEVGRAGITVNGGGTALCSAGCDFTFTPTSPTVGQPVQFSETVNGGTSPYTFACTFGDGVSGTGQNPTHTYSAKGTFTVTDVITDSATPTHATFTVTHTITVIGTTLVVTISCGTATAGKPVTCTATITGGTQPYTTTWTATAGSPSTGTGTSFTTTFATKGSDTVSVSVKDANMVTATNSVTVTVVAQPLAVSISCGTATAGKPVTCTATPTGGTSPYSFTWSVDGVVQAGATTSTFTTTFATKGTHSVVATVKDANTIAATSNTVSKTVAAQPLAVSISCGTATAGKPVTCTATPTGGTSPYSFTWSVDGVVQAGATTSTFTTTFSTKASHTVVATVKDANLVSATSNTVSLTVAGQPLSVSISCGTATAGKPVTCTATPTGGTSPYSFTWSVDGVVQAGATTSTFTTTFATKGTHSVVATVKDANTISATSNTVSLTVAGQPLSVSISCGTATAGKPVTCTATPTGGTSPYSFTWSVDGVVQAGATTSTFTTTFSTKASHTVVATVRDSNAATATSNTVTVVVAAQPLTADFTFSPTSPLIGQSVTFTATASGGTSPYTFTWTFGDTSTGTGNPVSHSYATKGTFTVTLTVKDANTNTVTASHTIAVGSSPLIPSITFTPSSPTAGKPVSFSGSATGRTSPYTFTWTFGDTGTGSGASVSHTYAVKGSYTVTLTVKDANGSTQSTSQTVLVVGQPLAVSIICGTATAGKPVTCTATPTGGTAPYTFRWSVDGTTQPSTLATFTTTFPTKGSHTVVATVTDGNVASATSNTVSLVVGGQPLSVSVSCGSATAGKPVTCTATATGGTSPYSFTWSAANGSPSAGSGTSFTTTFPVKGTDSVAATVKDGNNMLASQTATVIVAGQPLTTDFSFVPSSPSAGQSVSFTATVSGGTAPYSFSWNFGDTTTGIGNP